MVSDYSSSLAACKQFAHMMPVLKCIKYEKFTQAQSICTLFFNYIHGLSNILKIHIQIHLEIIF